MPSIPKKCYTHITFEERVRIEAFLHAGLSQRTIARYLNRSCSTVSREIKRNGGKRLYNEELSQKKSQRRRQESQKKLRLGCSKVREYVSQKIQESPEQIAGRMSRDHPDLKTHHESIYLYIYRERRELISYLNSGCGRRRKRKYVKKCRRNKIPNRVPLKERGEISREFGHWECDLVGSSTSTTVLVLLEKMSRVVHFAKVHNKKSQTVKEAILKLLRGKDVKSITYDNGSENVLHEEINLELDCPPHFCEPYRSWEKGQIEYSIRLFRQTFPKKTCFARVRKESIALVENKLNNLPRKCLNFLTPLEMQEGKFIVRVIYSMVSITI